MQDVFVYCEGGNFGELVMDVGDDRRMRWDIFFGWNFLGAWTWNFAYGEGLNQIAYGRVKEPLHNLWF